MSLVSTVLVVSVAAIYVLSPTGNMTALPKVQGVPKAAMPDSDSCEAVLHAGEPSGNEPRPLLAVAEEGSTSRMALAVEPPETRRLKPPRVLCERDELLAERWGMYLSKEMSTYPRDLLVSAHLLVNDRTQLRAIEEGGSDVHVQLEKSYRGNISWLSAQLYRKGLDVKFMLSQTSWWDEKASEEHKQLVEPPEK